MAVVVDASALGMALVNPLPAAAPVRARLALGVCHAPHLVDAEIGHLLRRRVMRGELEANDAASLLVESAFLVDERHGMTGDLAAAAWALRDNLSFYDALYAALAAALGAPLLTADSRLAAAPGLPCAVELVGAT